MRYVGQSHELMLPFDKGYIDGFHKLHKKTYGYANTDYGIEVVNIRVRVIGKTKKPSLKRVAASDPVKVQAATKKTKCFYRGKWLNTNIYNRDGIHTRSRIKGACNDS